MRILAFETTCDETSVCILDGGRLLSNVIFLVFQFFFVFVLDLMIGYTITDKIARMLGGSIRLDLGGKLKLV